MSQQPQLALTLQNREFVELTDAGIEGYLQRLAYLGVLEKANLTKDE